MSILSERAMLSVLRISQFTARRLDKRVTQETLAAHGAASDAGIFTKRLLGKHALAAIQQIAGSARMYHYEHTLPWLDDGARILPATMHKDYWSQMQAYQDQFADAVDTFVANYDQYVDDARRAQNGLFDPADYPPAHKVRGKFGFDVALLPCPDASDFRVDLGDAAVTQIKTQIEARANAALGIAVRDVFERVLETVGAMASKLREYQPGNKTLRGKREGHSVTIAAKKAEGIFRDSLLTNVADLVALMPALNVTNDPRIDKLVSAMSKLTTLSPDTLRADDNARTMIADEAQAILDTVSAFID